MNDTEARLQESLLPIGHNAALAGQRQQQGGASQGTSARGGYVPVTTASYTTTIRSATEEDSWTKGKRYCWWVAVVLTVIIVFLVIALKVFLFKPIDHGQPKLDNSTAIEPNTKTKFNLLLSGPRNRVISLVGAAAWEYTIPIPTHPKIVIAAIGYYVERVEGKRRLRIFKDVEVTEDNFEDVKNVLVQPGMTETMRVVLSTTPPNGRLLEMWKDNTDPILQRVCPNLADQEWNAFSTFFPDPFNKGDDFSFEWREGGELYAYKKDEDRAKGKRIGGPCMARALFESQLESQKQALVNLLDDFFER